MAYLERLFLKDILMMCIRDHSRPKLGGFLSFVCLFFPQNCYQNKGDIFRKPLFRSALLKAENFKCQHFWEFFFLLLLGSCCLGLNPACPTHPNSRQLWIPAAFPAGGWCQDSADLGTEVWDLLSCHSQCCSTDAPVGAAVVPSLPLSLSVGSRLQEPFGMGVDRRQSTQRGPGSAHPPNPSWCRAQGAPESPRLSPPCPAAPGEERGQNPGLSSA